LYTVDSEGNADKNPVYRPGGKQAGDQEGDLPRGGTQDFYLLSLSKGLFGKKINEWCREACNISLF